MKNIKMLTVYFCCTYLLFISNVLYAQSRQVSVVKDGKAYVCQSKKSSWIPGLLQGKKFISFLVIRRQNHSLYYKTKNKKYKNLAKKYGNLFNSGRIACNHRCGNGVKDTDVGELCDDGNRKDTDSCSNSCRPVGPAGTIKKVCGDGIVNQASEQCDDGNQVETDSCNNSCIPVSPTSTAKKVCGDGIVNQASEQCDDGNQEETDSCNNLCNSVTSVKVCGDGIVNQTSEECDDANSVDNDSCRNTCVRVKVQQVDAGGDHTCALLNTGYVKCWGAAYYGQLGYGNTTPISSASTANFVDVGGTVTQVVTGRAHTCALLSTGSVRCWGDGDDGVLGYGNKNDIGDDETPASVGDVNIGGTVVQLAAGDDHTCALLNNGNVRCWGQRDSGKLGYMNTRDIGDDETPASAGDVNIGGIVVQIAAGLEHTCALLNNGAVRCWGEGDHGKLGYMNTHDIETPASAGDVNIGGTAIQIAVGGSHTCALLTSGAVKCWGDGYAGQLGYGNTNDLGDNETPASVGDVNVGGTVTQIVTGTDHTCALLTTGAVRCWGAGSDEQLGWGAGHDGLLGYGNINNVGDNETPASIGDVNIGSSVKSIAAGNSHTCAVLTSGGLNCWGSGYSGQLGNGIDGVIGDNETPNSVNNLNFGNAVSQVSTSFKHACVLLTSGAVRCWGYGREGQLGYGNTLNIFDPESIQKVGDVDIGGIATQITTGENHSCALLNDGNVKCWGLGQSGSLGYVNKTRIGDNESPASVGNVNIGGSVIQIATGRTHNCALLSTGSVRCWGEGRYGQLGYGNTANIGDNETPASAGDVNIGGIAVQISAGGRHSCALLNTGAIKCWGVGIDGRLGYGNTASIGDNETPASVGNVNLGGIAVQVTAGDVSTCAVLNTGAVKCWGYGHSGMLGYENTNTIGDSETPASVGNINIGGPVRQVAVGSNHACAILDSGAVRCWGDGSDGALGYGNIAKIGDNESPASAGNVNIGANVNQISSRNYSNCAVLSSGAVKCWGIKMNQSEANVGDNESPASNGPIL